jgi:hypothetical protein
MRASKTNTSKSWHDILDASDVDTDESMFWSFDELGFGFGEVEPMDLELSPNMTRVNRRQSMKPNKIKKGDGAESKRNSPDEHDDYDFERESWSYIHMRIMGYDHITLDQVALIGKVIRRSLRQIGIFLTPRNRPARRRKPNAFHWLDSNMATIGMNRFDSILFQVLGFPQHMNWSAQ